MRPLKKNAYEIKGNGMPIFIFISAILFILMGIMVKKKVIRKEATKVKPYTIYMVMAGALILRLALMGCDGYTTDIDCFKAWATHAAKSLSNFYSGELFTDYPPGYIYVLWLVGKIKDLFSLSTDSISFLYLIKMPAVLADLISIYFIYWLASHKINPRVAIGLAWYMLLIQQWL